MASAVFEIVSCLLLLAAVRGTSIQPKKIVYVGKVNGTLDLSCQEDKVKPPNSGVEIPLNGVEVQDSTTVNVKYKCKRKMLKGSVTDACHGPPCPTWFFPDRSLNGRCRCGDDVHGVVRCNDSTQQAFIRSCHCMTYNESTGPVVGACFYNLLHPTLTHTLYDLVPSNITKLNKYMCGHLNREGQLCGKCKENHSIPVYSYEMKCVHCSTSPFNWVKYILAAFLPLTVFFILVVSCRLSATSPKLFAFVFFSQFVSAGENVRVVLEEVVPYPIAASLVKILVTLYGFWNLDFFRTLLPHICVRVNTLQALALDYAIAFYPLILLVLTYILIQVHICNFRVIKFMCRPFHRCANCLKSQCDVRTSIVDAFATFLLLSYVKLFNVTANLLIPTHVHYVNGSLVGLYLYYDATIEYFGEEHLPYGVLAVFVLLVFILFPLLLLLLYPMRCFQRCLDWCGVRWHALPIFIDAFQGCYKDGTDGTRDCRYFPAAFLFARILFFIIFVLSPTALFYGAALFVLIFLVMALVIGQPYKPRFSTYNAVDSVLVLLLALLFAAFVCFAITGREDYRSQQCFVILSFIVGVIPLFYISFVTLHWMYSSRRPFGRRMIGGQIGENDRQMVATGSEESLPNRLINPEEYEKDLTDPIAAQVEED